MPKYNEFQKTYPPTYQPHSRRRSSGEGKEVLLNVIEKILTHAQAILSSYMQLDLENKMIILFIIYVFVLYLF